MNSIGIVFGFPRDRIETDPVLGRLTRRRARLLGRPATSAPRSETKLQRDIDVEVKRFKASAKDGHRYVFVPLSDVPQETRDEVTWRVRRAANVVAGFPASSGEVVPPLPMPVVRYFRPARDGERADFTDPRRVNGLHAHGTNFIDIRADLSPREAGGTATHEVHHWSGRRDCRDEGAAARFASGLVAR